MKTVNHHFHSMRTVLTLWPSTIYLYKDEINDMTVDIIWGAATRITGITGFGLGGVFNTALQEGIHNRVINHYNGLGTLTINKSFVDLLLLAFDEIPNRTVLTFNVVFDQGAKEVQIIVLDRIIPPSISLTSLTINVQNMMDIQIHIIWNDGKQIDNITMQPFNTFAHPVDLKEGSEYTIVDHGDGTALLTIHSTILNLLPVPVIEIPDGSKIWINVGFDCGGSMICFSVVNTAS